MKRRYILLVALLVAAVVYFGSRSATPETVEQTTATPSVSISARPSATPRTRTSLTSTPKPLTVSAQIENRLIVLTNTERTKNNLPPFQATAALTSLAREHSQDMATNNYFSHTDLTGGSPSDRATKAGISNKELPDGSFEIGVAENIGLITGANLTAEAVAQMQIANWMNSPGHRANILNPQYTEIGIGTALRDTSYYSTQNFR